MRNLLHNVPAKIGMFYETFLKSNQFIFLVQYSTETPGGGGVRALI